jgi:hypothetical protein
MKFKSFNIVKMCLMNKIEFRAGKFLYQNFATIISVRFTLLLEKGRVRIQEAQKHTDPTDPRLDSNPVPEFIDPVFTKTSPKRSFSLNRKRAFWLVFAKTGSIISGTEHWIPLFQSMTNSKDGPPYSTLWTNKLSTATPGYGISVLSPHFHFYYCKMYKKNFLLISLPSV